MSTMSAADKKAYAAQREEEKQKRSEEAKALLKAKQLAAFEVETEADFDEDNLDFEQEEDLSQQLEGFEDFIQITMGASGKVFRVALNQAMADLIPGLTKDHGRTLYRFNKNHNLLANRPNKKYNYTWDFADIDHAKKFAKAWCLTGDSRGGGTGEV